MNEINLNIIPQKYQQQGEEITINVENNSGEELEYKFLLGHDSKWKMIKDFSKDNTCIYKSEESGDIYFIVQARVLGSKMVFDYTTREKYEVRGQEGSVQEATQRDIPLEIEQFKLDKEYLKVGEKLHISSKCNRKDVVYKFMVREDGQITTIKDIGPQNEIDYHFRTPGNKEILMKCFLMGNEKNKAINLAKNVIVEENSGPKIEAIECDKDKLFINNVVRFNVKTTELEKSQTLYKFMSVRRDGNVDVLKEYSSTPYVEVMHKKAGEFEVICSIKNIFSIKEWDDRAKMVYKIKSGRNYTIQAINTDLASPQQIGTEIKIAAVTQAPSGMLYRFQVEKVERHKLHMWGIKEKEIETKINNIVDKIENKVVLDSEYSRVKFLMWTPEVEGDYIIRCLLKRENEDWVMSTKEVEYKIEKLGTMDGKIIGVKFSSDISKILVNQVLNISVESEKDYKCDYKFKIFSGEEEIHSTEYSADNEVEFVPKQEGIYKLDVMVRGNKSSRDFDSKETYNINVIEFIPGNIKYILYDIREYYVKDEIDMQIVASGDKDLRYRYKVFYNGILTEESDYEKHNLLKYKFQKFGRYRFEFNCKNEKSNREMDDGRTVIIDVRKNRPIISSNILCINNEINVGREVSFCGECNVRKEIIYEFYLYGDEQWKLVQRYSDNNRFSYTPKKLGAHKLLMMVKHVGTEDSYEHYCIKKFVVKS